MNDSKNSSKGLLVLKVAHALTNEEAEKLTMVITPTAEALGVEPVVLPAGVDIELQIGSSALLQRICEALEEIAAQGRMPEVNVAEIAPQALNARPTGLNSRTTADLYHGTDFPDPSAEGTFVLPRGEKVAPRG